MDPKQILPRQLVVGEMLARRARKEPTRVALVEEERHITYQELNGRVNKLAYALSQLGIGRDDKVALLMFNCSQMVECYFALAKLGAVAVPINFRFLGREVAYILNHSESRMVVYDGVFFNKMISDIREQVPDVKDWVSLTEVAESEVIIYEKLLQSGSEDEPMIPVFDDDPAYIMYTSGTTGLPKGAVITHKNIFMSSINAIIDSNVTSDDVLLCVPPIFHSAALASVFMIIFLGARTVMVKMFNPASVVETVPREGVTCIFLVPIMWQMVLEVPGAAEKLAGLRYCISGAATMSVSLKKELANALPNASIIDAFGLTEMSPVTTSLKPKDFLRKPGTIGTSILNVEMRLVDDQGRDVPQGEVGEMIYRGPTMMKEYYNDPEATAKAFVDGWFYSGDLARLDEEGFIYLVDRKKDMLVSGGENVYSAEVEDVLSRHEDILEVAVIGVPDKKWGERVHAVVVPKTRSSITAEEIMEWSADKLAGYKKPRSVDFINALPRNATGKVLKTQLRRKYYE